MTTRTPKWAVGMRKAAAGAYFDADGALHICSREVCEYFGVPVTEENCRIAEEAAIRAITEAGVKVEHREMEDTD